MSAATNHRLPRLTPLPAVALALALATSPGGAAEAVKPLPVLAVDPLVDLAETESSTQALRHLVSRGVTGAVLLSLDLGNHVAPLQGREAQLARIRGVIAQAPAPAADPPRGLASVERSFVRVAVALGIAREVCWVMPYDVSRSPDPTETLRAALRTAGLLEEELRTFAMREGCLRGTVEGAPFAACGLAELPRIDEPVIADVETDFVLAGAAVSQENPIDSIRKLFAALSARGYRVRHAFVNTPSESRDLLLTTPDVRWIGEALAQSLREPGLLARPGLPKRWSALTTAAVLQSQERFSDLIHELSPFLTVHEDDPALQLSAAQATAAKGRLDEALGRAETACRLDRRYCAGLSWIGLSRFEVGDIDGGERFFAAAARLRPEMLYGQLARGLWLKGAGRSAAALAVFEALSEAGEAFPAAFLAGALHLASGERAAARRQFDKAVEALRLDPSLLVIDADTAQAVSDAARLYRTEGQADVAAMLEGNPRLQRPPTEGPSTSP